jgi:hypothetical protein
MTRKRTTDKESTVSTATVAAEPPASDANGNGQTVAAEAPASDVNGNPQSFADKVGQKQRPSMPDPFGIATDAMAGVRLFESKQDRQMAIKFGEGRPEDKPSQAVIDKMKESGYRWNPADRIWAHPVRGGSAMSTRIDAETLFQEVRKMIRAEKGIDQDGQQIPF